MAKFLITPTVQNRVVISARLGAGALATRMSDVDVGKPVKLVGDSQYNLVAAADAIEGVVTSIETGVYDGFVLGGVQSKGYINATPGASIDYEFVVADMLRITDGMNIAAVGFDRWRIDILQKELTRAGVELPLVECGQGFKDMSPALDALEGALLNGTIRHGLHPVLTMCAANAAVDSDPAGNRKLTKQKSTGRIDGMVALAMAFAVTAKEDAEAAYHGQVVYDLNMA